MTRPIPLMDEPDDAALAALDFPLRACPDCGFVGVRSLESSGGALPGSGAILSAVSCPHCRYEGLPAEFDEPEDYRDYVAALHRAWRKRE